MSLIIKWTIGRDSEPISPEGVACLRISVKKMRRMLPNAKFVVCFNSNIDLRSINADEFIDQREITCDLPKPKGPAWKLYPPRLDINSHEIWIDNDLILWEIPPAMDRFIKSERSFLISEAMQRSYSDKFDKMIPEGILYNTGIVGLPPKFDLKSHIMKHVNKSEDWSGGRFAEQGLMTLILNPMNPEIVTRKEVSVLTGKIKYEKGTHGIHLCGLNYRGVYYWNKFINSEVPLC